MTDLKQAAEMALEALDWVVKDNDSYDPFNDKWDDVHKSIHALRQALDQLPDTTEMMGQTSMSASELADKIKRGEKWKIAEPDMGIDRGAWDDVEDVTQWLEELRGNEKD